MGQEVIPALRDMSKELQLVGPFESNDNTGISPEALRMAKASGLVK